MSWDASQWDDLKSYCFVNVNDNGDGLFLIRCDDVSLGCIVSKVSMKNDASFFRSKKSKNVRRVRSL